MISDSDYVAYKTLAADKIRELASENLDLQFRLNTLAIKYDLLSDLQARHDDALQKILNQAPECWPDDDSPENAFAFVDSLINGSTEQPGHADDCDCFG